MSTTEKAVSGTSKITVTKDLIAHDFANAMHGKLDQEKIDSNVESILRTTSSYPATGSIASMIFYLKVQVVIKNGGKTFNGNTGGISTPGGGALFGDVYTDNLEKLYKETKSFELNATSVYLSILFFDSHSNLLGHFQSGAVSTVNGIGGGTGSWS